MRQFKLAFKDTTTILELSEPLGRPQFFGRHSDAALIRPCWPSSAAKECLSISAAARSAALLAPAKRLRVLAVA